MCFVRPKGYSFRDRFKNARDGYRYTTVNTAQALWYQYRGNMDSSRALLKGRPNHEKVIT